MMFLQNIVLNFTVYCRKFVTAFFIFQKINRKNLFANGQFYDLVKIIQTKERMSMESKKVLC